MNKVARLFFVALIPVILGIASAQAGAQQIALQNVALVETSSSVLAMSTTNDVIYSDGDETNDSGGSRLVEAEPMAVPRGVAAYGPFRVLDSGHAALVDVTGPSAPAQFSAMLHDFPGIKTLELIECPGTDDDRANLKLGRMIHARGLATNVPDGGSVRSGGVELFLAGVRHTAAKGAEFAVHSWADDTGHEAADFSADSPENRAYLDYYRDMGMAADQAKKFYAMTNSVPNAQAKWLSASDMGHWVSVN